MKLVELIKQYAGTHRTDKALLSYLETETKVAHFDPEVEIENVTDEWMLRFGKFAGMNHVGNVKKVLKYFTIIVFQSK